MWASSTQDVKCTACSGPIDSRTNTPCNHSTTNKAEASTEPVYRRNKSASVSQCRNIRLFKQINSPSPSKMQPLTARHDTQYNGCSTQSIRADTSEHEYCTGTNTHRVGRMSVLATSLARQHAHSAAATKHNTVHLTREGPQACRVVSVVEIGTARI